MKAKLSPPKQLKLSVPHWGHCVQQETVFMNAGRVMMDSGLPCADERTLGGGGGEKRSSGDQKHNSNQKRNVHYAIAHALLFPLVYLGLGRDLNRRPQAFISFL